MQTEMASAGLGTPPRPPKCPNYWPRPDPTIREHRRYSPEIMDLLPPVLSCVGIVGHCFRHYGGPGTCRPSGYLEARATWNLLGFCRQSGVLVAGALILRALPLGACNRAADFGKFPRSCPAFEPVVRTIVLKEPLLTQKYNY